MATTPTTTTTTPTPTTAELTQNFIQKYTGNRSCFILGATGETGKRLTRQIILSGAFSLVKVVARRQLAGEYMPEPPAGVKVEQIIVSDFDALPEDSQILSGCDFGFCALGSTKKKAGGEQQFYKIDHDLTLKMLRLAKASGCKYLALVSAMGASSSSIFLYSKTKGQLENDAIELQFDALRIYRPAMIQVKRQEERIGEEIGLIIAPVLDFCTFGRMAVKVEVLAEAMLLDALRFGSTDEPESDAKKKLLFISNKEIKKSVPKPLKSDNKSEEKSGDKKESEGEKKEKPEEKKEQPEEKKESVGEKKESA